MTPFLRAEVLCSLYEIEDYVKKACRLTERAVEREYARAIAKNDYEDLRTLSASSSMAHNILRYLEENIKKNDLEIDGKPNTSWDFWRKFFGE